VEPNLANMLFYKNITESSKIIPPKNASWMLQDFYKLYNEFKYDYSSRAFLFALFLIEDVPELFIEILVWINFDFDEADSTKKSIFLFSFVTTLVHLCRHIYLFWCALSAKNKIKEKLTTTLDFKDLIRLDYEFEKIKEKQPRVSIHELVDALVDVGVEAYKGGIKYTSHNEKIIKASDFDDEAGGRCKYWQTLNTDFLEEIPDETHFVSLKFKMSDQCWGFYKGKLHVVKNEPGTGNTNETDFTNETDLNIVKTVKATRNGKFMNLHFTAIPHSEYSLWVVVGGGGGHSLHIKEMSMLHFKIKDFPSNSPSPSSDSQETQLINY